MEMFQTVPLNSMAVELAQFRETSEYQQEQINALKLQNEALSSILRDQKEKLTLLTDVLLLVKDKASICCDIETKQRVTLALKRAGETTRSILSRNLG